MSTAAKSRRSNRWGVCAASLLSGACAASLPGPPPVIHPESAYTEVPYPPPAALVEAVPPSPSSALVWMDGNWTWQGQFYVWMRGGWVLAPTGASFAQCQWHYTRSAQLMFASGAWYASNGSRIRPPLIQLSAYTPPNESTAEFQTAR
jgi:hypothetical protein